MSYSYIIGNVETILHKGRIEFNYIDVAKQNNTFSIYCTVANWSQQKEKDSMFVSCKSLISYICVKNLKDK